MSEDEVKDYRDRLAINTEVSDEFPVVKGTFITTQHIINLVVDGWSWRDIMDAHPELTSNDIRACLQYYVYGPIPGMVKSDQLKIVRVEYRKLQSFGNYSNETVGAVAEVSDGRDPVAALIVLRDWVGGQLGLSQDAELLRDEVSELRREKVNIERELNRAKETWKRAAEFLEKHGIDPEDIEEMPF